MTDVETYMTHATTVEEVGWGGALIAITMTIHAFGMLVTLTASGVMQQRLRTTEAFFPNLWVLLLASWTIVLVHLSEVAVWAAFFYRHDALPTLRMAYYYALLQYVTVGSEVTLPERWRLLGGLIGMAGLLTFAWSTTVLLTLARAFQDKQLEKMKRHNL